MRIDDLNRTPSTQSPEKTDAGQKRPLDKDAAIAGGEDRAEVSNLAQALGPRDPQRLEQLRLAVQSGTYDVPADIVAKAIVDAHSRE